ncbi:MAG: glycerate kinase [Verrucomicrobiales bacterium]|nr:glycerate kinase [Verrucomicrobiales bacterium]
MAIGNGVKIVVASDSFKGCLSSAAVADAVARGIRRVSPSATVVKVPVADGGEGTVEALTVARGGVTVSARAHDPLMRAITAAYGVLPDGTAVIEMAAASGLPLLTAAERNPLVTSSAGTGELVADALRRGCRRFIIGLGGSATNDGGAGMLRALGVEFSDADGARLPEGGAALARLSAIDLSGLDARLADCELLVACDVTNPLCGARGASAVYGPQKGATPLMVTQLDAALARYALTARRLLGRDIAELPGAGAAGGLGAALLGFLNAELRSGIDLIVSEAGLREKLAGADLLITGEGRLDAQSRNGKAAYGILRAGRAAGVPVAAIVGQLDADRDEVLRDGFAAVCSLRELAASSADSLARAAELLELAAERVFFSPPRHKDTKFD